VVTELKKNGYTIIGYARKSPGEEENRITNLEDMVKVLKERSLVDKCYVSPMCKASDELAARDLKDKSNLVKKTEEIEGNTQGMYF
jgi:hypothetical protein